MKKLRIAEIVFAIAGAVAFGSSWLMNFWLWKAMPTKPNVEQGFTIPMINHGQTIYLTPFYSGLYDILFWGGLALFVCAVVVDFYLDPFNWRPGRK